MLQQIDTKHLAALESELARVTKQRDALRDALLILRPWAENSMCFAIGDELESADKDMAIANAALQACQD